MITSTRFIDGPAASVNLNLRRAPVFLRVTFGLSGVWDALDEAGDTPRPDEVVYAYVLATKPGMCHMSGRTPGGKRWGEARMTGEYRFIPDQPRGAALLDTTAWRAWCAANLGRLGPAWARNAVMP